MVITPTVHPLACWRIGLCLSGDVCLAATTSCNMRTGGPILPCATALMMRCVSDQLWVSMSHTDFVWHAGAGVAIIVRRMCGNRGHCVVGNAITWVQTCRSCSTHTGAARVQPMCQLVELPGARGSCRTRCSCCFSRDIAGVAHTQDQCLGPQTLFRGLAAVPPIRG